MADNKSCGVNLSQKEINMLLECGIRVDGVDYSSIEDYTVETTFDINGTIKGLKAIQREAKKATAALKEYEKYKDKHLVIELKKLGDVPKIFYQGEEVSNKEFIKFEWHTKTERPGNTEITVDYYELNNDGFPTGKSIRENRRS